MTVSQSSNPVHLSDGDVAYLAALRRAAQLLQAEGDHRRAWSYSAELCELLNRGTLEALSSGKFTENELLVYGEVPESYEQAQSGRKTVKLKLSLYADSPLAREIEEVLKKHMKGQTIE